MKKTLLFLLLFSSCSSKYIINSVQKNGSTNLDFSMNTIVPDDDSYEAILSIENLSKKTLIIFTHDFVCEEGAQRGNLTFFDLSTFRAGQVYLKSLERRDFKIKCSFLDLEGFKNPSFKVAKVYDNPNHDLRTIGRAIEEKLVWSAQLEKE